MSKAADFSSSQLAKILYGFAAAGCPDAALAKAVLGALGGKAGAGASATDLCQVVYAMAKMGRWALSAYISGCHLLGWFVDRGLRDDKDLSP